VIQVLTGLACLFAFCLLLGIVYQKRGTRRDLKAHPPPGRLVDLGTHRLHILELGRGDETVVMEAGLMSTVLSWTALQRELSKSFKTISYDRAGLGWSDLGPMPRTADRIVDELHSLLRRAGINPPYVLVGHSFGGLVMPLFAARFPDEVAGMVLIDPVVPEEWSPPPDGDLKLVRIGADVCWRAAFLARFGVCRLIASLLSVSSRGPARHLLRLITRGTPADAGSVSSPWFFALPAEERAMASVFWTQRKFALTIASQLGNLPWSARSLAGFGACFHKPVVVLSAQTASQRRREGHAAMADRLPFGELVSSRSNHWIMQQESDLVVRAIKNVVDASRSTSAARRKSA
jgi:pimeloyl-ACP methyl ester carboxylesterase